MSAFLLFFGLVIVVLSVTLFRTAESIPLPVQETIQSRSVFETESDVPSRVDTFEAPSFPEDVSLPLRLTALMSTLNIQSVNVDETEIFSTQTKLSSDKILRISSSEEGLYTFDWGNSHVQVRPYHPSCEFASVPMFDRFHRAGDNVVYVPVFVENDPVSEYILHFYADTDDRSAWKRRALIGLCHSVLNRVECILAFLCKRAHSGSELRVVHITCHTGCEKHIDYVSSRLGWTAETFNIIRKTKLNADSVFNVLPDRADAFWEEYKHLILGRDLVIVSDTAPISRVILRHMDEFKGNLIVWVCNRFDYAHNTSGESNPFPDEDWYRCICEAPKTFWNRVRVVSYTKFERIYALDKFRFWGGPFADAVIRPIGTAESAQATSPIPAHIRKSEYLFIPPYINDELLIDFEFLNAHNIRWYRGRYGGAQDLVGFRAVLHVPYAYSNLALFENLTNGLVYYLPSLTFMTSLVQKSQWFQDGLSRIHLAEWYDPTNANLFVYFDSWEDLAAKLSAEEHVKRADAVTAWVAQEQRETLLQWQAVTDFPAETQ